MFDLGLGEGEEGTQSSGQRFLFVKESHPKVNLEAKQF